jgi:hypothetical protein
MRPGDIRVEPWIWIPASSRPWGRAIALALLALTCAVVGIVVGRLATDRPEVQRPQPQAASTPKPKSAPAGPKQDVQPTLAIRGTEPTKSDTNRRVGAEPGQDTPRVVIINPGTADQKGRRDLHAAGDRDDRNRAERPAPGPAARDRQARESFGSTAPNYQALRDRFLGR